MELSAEQAAVRDAVKAFAVEEIRPRAPAAEAAGEIPADLWDGLADLDLTGLTVPEEYGGVGADRVTYAVAHEAVAYGDLAVATALSVHCLAASCIADLAPSAIAERWLPDMATGRPVGAFALSEPGAGSNPREMRTEAVRDGGEYVIDGEKQWITNGRRAGVIVLFAKVDRDDPDSITAFLVPADVDGLEVGPPEAKLGIRASDTAPLTFRGARIPAENRLTPEGDGLRAALAALTGGRVGIAALAVGVAEAALDEAAAYATEREQFGRPIGEFQAIRHKLAEMATRVRAARLLVRDAARRADAGGDARIAASMAKYRASETAVAVANEALQIHGAYGYVAGDVERFYRDAKITEIYEGTTEIQKDLIGEAVLSGSAG